MILVIFQILGIFVQSVSAISFVIPVSTSLSMFVTLCYCFDLGIWGFIVAWFWDVFGKEQ